MYQIPDFRDVRGIKHVLSTVDDGNMANFILGREINYYEVLSNREAFLKKNGFKTDKTICMWVNHGDEVLVADTKRLGISIKSRHYVMKCDSLITNQNGISLFLLIADCLAVIIFDPKNEVLALVHAGWKGADNKILTKTVDVFVNKYKSKPVDLLVGFSPAARKDSYIKKDPEILGDKKWKKHLVKISNCYSIDFVGLCKDQLIKRGVLSKNIYDCGIDTITDNRFFSHYRDCKEGREDIGRFACVVGMV